MRKLLASLSLLVAVVLLPSCASTTAQSTEFKSVSAAAATVEAARVTYYDLRTQCTANPASTTLCPQILAAHDKLAAAYLKYQGAVKLLADANVAILSASAPSQTLQDQLAAATAGVLQVASDFVTLEASTTGK